MRFNREQEEELRIELREVYYRYYGASMGQIDPLQVIREAFVLVSRMHLRLPTRFALLDKALATLGGVGTELYPDFNVFEVAEPYAAELVARRYSPRRLAERALGGARELHAACSWSCPTRCTTRSSSCATARSRCSSGTRAWTSSRSQADVVANRLVIAIVMAATHRRLVADRDLGRRRLAHLRHPCARAGWGSWSRPAWGSCWSRRSCRSGRL